MSLTDREARATVVYVEQYGGWWKLTRAQWLQCCKDATTGEGYNLPRECQLMRRPGKAVGMVDYGGDSKPSYYAISDHAVVLQPLDWFADQFREWLEHSDER